MVKQTCRYLLGAFILLQFSCAEREDGRVVTWSADIAPIVHRHCSSCHRPGESGPFNLLSYADAVARAGQIRFVTRKRYMPPWPADPSYRHFVGENVLSDEQVRMISSWVDQKTPRGDSLSEPPPPEFYTGSYFGKPDLVIRCPEPVQIKGNGTDAFLILKFPYRMKQDTFAELIEFVPHRRKLIHHVNGHLLNYDDTREFDHVNGRAVSADTRARLPDVYEQMHIPYTDGKEPQYPPLSPNTVYYLPGYLPPQYPDEIGGIRMKKNGVFLLNNIHYGPSREDVADSSHINVFFRKQKVTRPIQEAQLGTFGISPIEPEFVIPANTVRTFSTSLKLSKDISLLSVNPHMHLIGTRFLAYAVTPSGDTVPLIRINKWNFRWQYYYTYKNPLKLVAGTTIHVFGTFDNTSKNTDNPFFPPRTITQGNGIESMKTSEEMFQFIFTYLPYREGDENIDLSGTDSALR